MRSDRMKTTTVAQDIQTLLEDPPGAGIATAARAEARALWDKFRLGPESDPAIIVHIGTLLALDFCPLLVLVLKHQCECVSEQAGTDAPMTNKRFTPDSASIFNILSKYGHVPNGLAYDPQSLADTIRELILIDGHVVANNSPELRAFAERSRRSGGLWQTSSRKVQEVFRAKKGHWLDLQDQLGEQLLFLEARRLANEALTQRWLALFGETYLALEEQAARVDSLRRRIELKLGNPELTREALDQRMREAESSRTAKLRTLRSRLAVASLGIIHCAGEVISPEELSEYRRQCKALLRTIWLLLHPDALTQHPQYEQLTDKQRSRLSELWHRAMAMGHDCSAQAETDG